MFNFERFMDEYYNNSVGIYFDDIDNIDTNILDRMSYSHKMSYVFFSSPEKRNKKRNWKNSNIKYINVRKITPEIIEDSIKVDAIEYMLYSKMENLVLDKKVVFA